MKNYKLFSNTWIMAVAMLICLSFMLGMSATAAYLTNIPKTLKQPDGKIINAFATGDEYYHWIHDAGGYVIIKDTRTNLYTYAILENGDLKPSKFIVGKVDPAGVGLVKNIQPSAEKLSAIRSQMRSFMMPPKSKKKTSGSYSALSGEQKVNCGVMNNLVIFIRFKDELEFEDAANTYSEYNQYFNTSANSVRNYFQEASYGQLKINSSFYPESPSAGSDTIVSYEDRTLTRADLKGTTEANMKKEHDLLKRAVDYVNNLKQIPNGLNLDYNNDGYVDNIVFIIKGDVGEWGETLWPHEWRLTSAEAFINNKRVGNYDLLLQNASSPYVICHEMFHSLGAPDLYHYSKKEPTSILDPCGQWDIMDKGGQVHMGAYMKYRYGNWIPNIPEITTTGTYTINPLTESTNNCYKIKSPYSDKEYFAVEYRRQTGQFESGIPSSGLLVYRINGDRDGYGNADADINGEPDDVTDEVYIYRPLSNAMYNGLINEAAYSSDYGKTEIDDHTFPSSFLSHREAGGLNISEVGTVGDQISFKVTLDVETPTFSPDTCVSALPQTVAISCPTPYTNIHYTTNGQDPTESDLTYVNPITISNSLTLKAKAFRTDLRPSKVKRAVFTIGTAKEVTIGASDSTWDFPTKTAKHDARTQTIYLASEIGDTPTKINALSLDVDMIPGQTMDNFTIRMKHTPLAEYSAADWGDSDDWTEVYKTSETISSIGWNTFLFTTPFDYNGTDNVLVDISFNDTNRSTSGLCHYSLPGGSRTLVYSSNSLDGDPLAWADANPSPELSYNVPNVKFITGSDLTIPVVNITSPIESPAYITKESTLTLEGTAIDSDISGVYWKNETTGDYGTCTGTSNWSVGGIVLINGSNTITISASDAYGNVGKTQFTAIYDPTASTVTITSPTSGDTYTTTEQSITLGGIASDNIAVTDVSWVNLTSGDTGICENTENWTANSIPLVLGQNYIEIIARDSAGHVTKDNITIIFNDLAPASVTINQATSQNDPTDNSPIKFTVVFSKPVTGFTESDVKLGGTANALAAIVTGSGTTYNVEVNGMSNTGSVIASIPEGAALDIKGIANTASISVDNEVRYDIDPPTVTVEQSDSQADPTNLSTINFKVVFSKSVTGFASDDVTLGGTAGASSAIVTGSGTTYNVAVSGMTQSGTVTLDVVTAAAYDLAGNPSVGSTSIDNSVVYDNISPSFTIDKANAQADPTNSSPINFTVVFSEDLESFTDSDVNLTSSSGDLLNVVVTGSGNTYNVAVSGMTQSGDITASISAGAVTDIAGNANIISAGADKTVAFDITAPTVTINQAAGQADPSTNSSINFTAVFSEDVVGFGNDDVTLVSSSGDILTGSVTGSGKTYNIAVTGMTQVGTVTATIASDKVVDAAGNGNTASASTDNVVVFNDGTNPTVTVDQAVDQNDPTKENQISFDVVFSKPVTDFTTEDVVLSGTAGATTATIEGSDANYIVTVTGMTNTGTVIVDIPEGAVVDIAGNQNDVSTSDDNEVTYDVDQPTVTINQAADQTDPSMTSPVKFTVVFSESVTGFDENDVLINGTAPGTKTVTVTGSGTTYDVFVDGFTNSGTVVANVLDGAAIDEADNETIASTSTDNIVLFNDGTGPSVTVNQASVQSDPVKTQPIRFDVVFSEPVSDFTNTDVTISGISGGSPIVNVTGAGTDYHVSVSGIVNDGTVIASVPAGVTHDVANNGNSVSTSVDNAVTLDATGPTVTMNQAAGQNDPTSSDSLNFTVAFSEAVTDFTNSDVVITGTAGATTATVTGSGKLYNVVVSGMVSSGTVIATIPADVVHDALGSANTAATSIDNSITLDLSKLTATINQAVGQADPVKGGPFKYTVVFSKPVTDFDAEDVAISGTSTGAKLVTLTGSDTTYTVSVDGMNKSGTIIASIAADKAHDSLGNGNIEAVSSDNTIALDMSNPTLAIVTPTSNPECTRNTSLISLSGTAADDTSIQKVAWSTGFGDTGECDGTTNWSVDDIQIHGDNDTITITTTDGVGNTASDTLKVNVIESLPGDDWSGLAMVSLPIIPDNNDPKPVVEFIGSSWLMFRPETNNYASYSSSINETWFTPAESTPGRGFWARFGDIPCAPYGMIPTQDQSVTIHLKTGWNLIGQPFISPVVWDAQAIKIIRGNREKSLADARRLGWVVDYLWGWKSDMTSASEGSYYLIYDSKIVPDAVGELAPWRSYWMKSKVDCDLVLPAP